MTSPAHSLDPAGDGLMRLARGRLVAALAAVRVAASTPPLLDPVDEARHGRLGKLAIRRFARSGLRLRSEASAGGPGARNGAADPEMPVGRSRLLILALVGLPVLINAVMLLPELTSGAPSLNDDAFHYLFVQRAADAIANGLNPLDFWIPQQGLGFPQFLYYQNLPHLAVVGLHAILAGTVDLFTTFNLVRYLLLVGFPLTVYWSMRRMGFSMVAAAVGAAASSLLSANFRYGFEYDSYIWRGFGTYTQLWGMHLSFISLACVWRVLKRGTGYLPAILALAALALSHLIYAYMMVITLGVVCLVFLRRGTIRATLTRLVILGGVVAVVTAEMWLPFLTGYGYLPSSTYLQAYKYDSFGAPAILGWLFSGDLLDHGRLPVLTVLLGLGLVVSIVRRNRLGIVALAGFLVWLVLYFGRPTLGPLADLMPLNDGLLFHRFIGEMDIFAIMLMGVGGAALWRTIARLRIPRLRPGLRPALALAAVLFVLFPAVTERIDFYAQNTIWMDQTADAFHSDADLQIILATLAVQPPGGRAYAGLRTNWGATMTVGQAKVTDVLTFAAVPAVSPPYAGPSLNSDLIWDFRDDDPGQFDLLDVRYVIAPTGLAVPSFYAPMQLTAKYTLYRVQTSGAVEYVAIVARRQVPTQRALFDANLAWFKGPDPDARRFIRWDYGTPVGPPTTSAGCPGGGKTDFEYDASDAVHVVVECPAAATLAIKVTYHPNWHVSVDGQPAETFMVSPSFVGIDLPAGKHTVDAVYEATPAKTPLFLLGLGVVGLAALFRRRLDWLPRRFETSSLPPSPNATRGRRLGLD
jgi:6-pyruvoyl-tetrahydropterin synthase related domain